MLNRLFQDEAGFIVSAELVLVATLLVIGLIVGLSEVQHAIVSELNDVADAIGSLNQSYCFSGFSAVKCGSKCGSHFGVALRCRVAIEGHAASCSSSATAAAMRWTAVSK